jgi:hypothetical protein
MPRPVPLDQRHRRIAALAAAKKKAKPEISYDMLFDEAVAEIDGGELMPDAAATLDQIDRLITDPEMPAAEKLAAIARLFGVTAPPAAPARNEQLSSARAAAGELRLPRYAQPQQPSYSGPLASMQATAFGVRRAAPEAPPPPDVVPQDQLATVALSIGLAAGRNDVERAMTMLSSANPTMTLEDRHEKACMLVAQLRRKGLIQ